MNLKNIRKKFWVWVVIISQVYASLAQATSTLVEQDALPSEKSLKPCVTNKVEWKNTGIDVTTNQSKIDYQLISKPISINSQSTLEVPFEVYLRQGGFAIGLLSEDQTKFLLYKSYRTPGTIKDKLSLPFGTTEKNVRLIFANNVTEPAISRFVIKHYILNQLPFSPEKTLTPFSPQKVEYKDQGIDVTTNASKWDYQLMSKPILVSGASDLSLTLEVDLKKGGFATGFLSEDKSKFLVYKAYHTLGLVKDTLRLPFGTSEKNVHVIFSNNVAENANSRFVIKNYNVGQAPLSPEKILTPFSPQKVEYTDQGIDVITNPCKLDYQLMSKPIAVPDASELSLSFEVDLKKGGFAAGFLSQDQKKFLVYKIYRTLGLVKDTLKLPADTLDKNFYLVFSNNVAEPAVSHFVIKNYTLSSPKQALQLYPTSKRNKIGIPFAQSYFYRPSKPHPYNPSVASEQSDVSFEVEKLDNNHLYFIGRENGKIILDQTILPSTLKEIQQGDFRLRRRDNLTVWTYVGQDGSRLALAVKDNGDIEFRPIDSNTGYLSHKAWSFKTTGNILNYAESCFYFLYLQASQVHNFGLIKCFGIDTQQFYFFNRGILHLGDDTGIASLDIYPEYIALIDEKAEPQYQEGVIDDYGVTLAEKGLKIGHMTHRVHRFEDTQQLELDQAPLEVMQQLNVTGPIIGTTPRFVNQGHIGASSITSALTVQDWTNKGEVRLSQPSEILARNELDNSGFIRSKGSLTLSSHKKPKSLGMVISDDQIKTMINEILSPDEQALVFGQARLLSKSRKLVVDMVHHTDHYLNTITNHYVQEKGGQRFTGKTETGYVFQYRTSERSQKVIEQPILEMPAEIEGLDRAFNDRQYLLSKLREGLKDRIRALMAFYDSVGGLQDLNKMLASALSGIGLDDEEVKDIVTDPGMQSLLMALGMPEKDALKLVEIMDDPQKLLYHSLIAMAQGGTNTAIQWIVKNPDAFINITCGSAQLLNLVPTKFFPPLAHPGIQVPLQGVNALCGIRGAQRSLPKIQATSARDTIQRQVELQILQ